MRYLSRLKGCDAVVEVTRRGACAGSAGKVNLKLGVERHLPLVTGITIQPCGVPLPQTTRDNVRQQKKQRQTSVDKGFYYIMV